MNTKSDHDTAEELSKLLLDTITLASPPQVPDRFASVDSLQILHSNLLLLRDFLYTAANGDLSGTITLKGYIGGTLKTLQANLRHMIWQTKMITAGDFTQRIDFMGEFSQSINAMVIQLDQTLKEVAKKDKELSKANAELLKEISIRKQTEAALREREEALKHLAITDSLTGLYNRRHFNYLAEIEISRVLRYSRPLSVMMLDIDFFKRVNDTYGHTSGDMVLQMVAKIVTEHLRATDIPSRYGGEEFIVLFPETTAADAATIAETLRKTIEAATIQGEAGTIAITSSFGVNDYVEKTYSQSHEKILREFIDKADRALYAAKNAGRNKVTVYLPEEDAAP
jgi:diguanylate cyclase (GGDEF)-like protein